MRHSAQPHYLKQQAADDLRSQPKQGFLCLEKTLSVFSKHLESRLFWAEPAEFNPISKAAPPFVVHYQCTNGCAPSAHLPPPQLLHYHRLLLYPPHPANFTRSREGEREAVEVTMARGNSSGFLLLLSSHSLWPH